jgi:prepilin-type N-terminal cleavage/methylation domain-containing protein
MKSKGFTLIEIIVSLAIFSIVAVIAIGALVRVTGANRQAQAIQSGVNNVSFLLDAISREMRVGSSFKCHWSSGDLSTYDASTMTVNDCSSIVGGSGGDTIVSFASSAVDPNTSTNLIYAYLFHKAPTGLIEIYKAEQAHSGDSLEGIANGVTTPGVDNFYPVTSQSVNITDYRVGIFGGNGDASHPYQWAYFRLKGYVGIKIKDQSVFDVDTSVSERIPG